MFKWIYLLLLVSSAVFVFWKGRFEVRLVAATLVIGSLLTPLLFYYSQQSWLSPNVAMLINEAAVTLVILFVAFRSKEFWPLPVAAFQMIALLTPTVLLVGENLASDALGIMQGLWAYLELFVLVIVTIGHQRDRKRGRAAPPN